MTVTQFPSRIRVECPLPVGSTVALRGGGVAMTVTEIFEPEGNTPGWFVECCWHNDVGDACAEVYPASALYTAARVLDGRAGPQA